MERPGMKTWIVWIFCSVHVVHVLAEPYYIVTLPGVLESGGETKVCASLLQPNETLRLTVTLRSDGENTNILQKTSNQDFHECIQFQVPVIKTDKILKCHVEVRGDTFYSEKQIKVKITSYKPAAFIQTDKPIYLPGQTVNFRVVSLDNKFRLTNQVYDIIELVDSKDNRIGQWLNQTSDKILQLSYSLNSEAQEGFYRINVKIGPHRVYQSFKVETYVLPKFDVTINMDKEVNIGQETFVAEVCAKYTYGQPVPGEITAGMCRSSAFGSKHSEIRPLCDVRIIQTDKRGCSVFTFKTSTFNLTDRSGRFGRVLEMRATVKEEGTGVSQQRELRVDVKNEIGKLSFIDTPKTYNRVSAVQGKVKAVHYNNTPIANMAMYLFDGTDQRFRLKLLQNLTTNSDGEATFTLNTDSKDGDVRLEVRAEPEPQYRYSATPFFKSGLHTLSELLSPSSYTKTLSSLEIKKREEPLPCESETEISIQYALVQESQGRVDIMYLILSRGAIIMQGIKPVDIQNQIVNLGEVSIKLKVTPDIAPEVQVVAYAVLPSENVIAHGAHFETEKCFHSKVSLEFSPSSAVPGEKNNIQLSSPPFSLCAMSVIDQSILIKSRDKILTADRIFHLLPVMKPFPISYDLKDPPECLHVRPRRYIGRYPGGEDKSAISVFEKLGVKVATNLVMQLPSCLTFKSKIYSHDGFPRREYVVMYAALPRGSAGSAGLSPPPIQTTRTFFPETWIWDLVDVGESGKKDVPVTVPDTITTWETETFCLSPEGFGLAPRVNLTVFQPFFLELTLPYSIVRGENFELKATVFNYLTSCIMIKVTAGASSDYSLTPLSGDQYKSCLCGSERKTLRWTLIPSALGLVNVTVTAEAVPSHASCDNEVVSVPERGRIDVVTRPLRVKAEGTEITKTHNWLLCPKGKEVKEEANNELPDDVIEGSARAAVSVLGDILGRALNNLEGLLQMPYGCGEQNMALLAPNIYILHYLKNTQQLTPPITEKSSKFLTAGYQRQLTYKDNAGAYSTFGNGPGNTWLTAFVLRSFSQAQAFVYIDPQKLDQSRTWLEQKQRQNGCFEKSGKLFNNRMKGGVSDEVTLSAYITAAFLEMNKSTHDRVVSSSLSCLKESLSDLSNTYTSALLAYVFTLAGDVETRARLLQHLDKVAIKEGGLIHWSQTASETSGSLSVEISSYVMLAILSAPMSAEDLGYTSSIVRWLTKQQNHYGGFSSTQDTVVALQALALYSTKVFSPEGSSTVTVQSESGQLSFSVNPDNKLVYQEKMLQDVKGKYSVEVKGTACASVQVSQHYNIPTPSDVTTLSVKVEPKFDCPSKTSRPVLTLSLQSFYSGKENTTNMVILDIKMLSGFVPDSESLKALKHALLVDRVEQKEDHVLVYLRELSSGIPINHSLALVQEVAVQNLKPAEVKIYDYYQPSDQAETEYTYTCGGDNNL